jgi:hypothetical protein
VHPVSAHALPHLPLISARARARAALWLAYAGFLALVVVLSFHHEPWRDEADAWLVARDAGVSELFRSVRYAGTPALWYLLEAPLARLGAPYGAQAVLNVAIAAVFGALLLFRSPFPRAARVLLLFGYFFSYEYAVVRRSYALTVALFFLALVFHARRSRAAGAAAALLANTSMHGAILAAGLACASALRYRRERRRVDLASALAAAAGLTLAAWQVRPPADGQLPPTLVGHYEPGTLLRAVAGAFFPVSERWWLTALPAVALLAAAMFVVAGARVARVALAVWLLGLTYLIGLKYWGGIRHSGFFLVAVVGALWMALEEAPGEVRARVRPALAVLGIASLLALLRYGALRWRDEIRLDFSGAERIAAFVNAHDLGERRIAAHLAEMGEAVAPYLPARRLYYPAIRAWGTYMRWDAAEIRGTWITNLEAIRRVRADLPDAGDADRGALLLLSTPLPKPERLGYRLLFANPGILLSDERFFLYAPAGR